MFCLLLVIIYTVVAHSHLDVCNSSTVEGFPAQITCGRTVPGATVRLRKGEMCLMETADNLSYSIEHALKSDEGLYTCEYISDLVFIDNTYLCVFEFHRQKAYNQEIWYLNPQEPNITLFCDIPARFPVSYEWRVQGVELLLETHSQLKTRIKSNGQGWSYECAVVYQNHKIAAKTFILFLTGPPSKPEIVSIVRTGDSLKLRWDPPYNDGGIPAATIEVNCDGSDKTHSSTLDPTKTEFTLDAVASEGLMECRVIYSNKKYSVSSDVVKINSIKHQPNFQVDELVLNNDNVVEFQWFQPAELAKFDRSFINFYNLNSHTQYQFHFPSQKINKQLSPFLAFDALFEITVNYFFKGNPVMSSYPAVIRTFKNEYHPVLHLVVGDVGADGAVLSWSSRTYYQNVVYDVNLHVCHWNAAARDTGRCFDSHQVIHVSKLHKNRSVQIRDLSPDTAYSVQIQQRISWFKKFSVWSSRVYFTTLFPKPEKPDQVRVLLGATMVEVVWNNDQRLEPLLGGFIVSLRYYSHTFNKIVAPNKTSAVFNLTETRPRSIAVSSFVRNLRSDEAEVLLAKSVPSTSKLVLLVLLGFCGFILSLLLTYASIILVNNRKYEKSERPRTWTSLTRRDRQRSKTPNSTSNLLLRKDSYKTQSRTTIVTAERDPDRSLKDRQKPKCHQSDEPSDHLKSKNCQNSTNNLPLCSVHKTEHAPSDAPTTRKAVSAINDTIRESSTTMARDEMVSLAGSPTPEGFLEKIKGMNDQVMSAVRVLDNLQKLSSSMQSWFLVVLQASSSINLNDTLMTEEINRSVHSESYQKARDRIDSLVDVVIDLAKSVDHDQVEAFKSIQTSLELLKENLQTMDSLNKEKTSILEKLADRCGRLHKEFEQFRVIRDDIVETRKSLSILSSLIRKL